MAPLLEFKSKYKEKYYMQIDVLQGDHGKTAAEISFKNITNSYDL